MNKIRSVRRGVLVSLFFVLSLIFGFSAARAGDSAAGAKSMMGAGMRHGGMGAGMRPGMRMMGGACASDLETYCAGKKGKEIAECMDANQDKLSKECKEFHALQKERHETMLKEREEVMTACKADIESFCKDDKIPLRCLNQKMKAGDSKISKGCSDKIQETQAKMKEMREKMRAEREKAKAGATSTTATNTKTK